MASETLIQHQSTKNVPLSFDQAERILHDFGSPLYVYFQQVIEKTASIIENSLPYQAKKFHFASVTNGNIRLLQIFRDRGWGLHANTPGDIYLGLQAGFSPADIVFSGGNLSCAEMQLMLDQGIATINLDSLAQLEQIAALYDDSAHRGVRFGMRLNLPEITGDSRIGVEPGDLLRAAKFSDEQGLPLRGVHFYRGTATNGTDSFVHAIDKLISAGSCLTKWEYLDFGGGFGFPYKWGTTGFDWQSFGQTLTAKLNQLNKHLQLVIEPGRSVIAESGIILCRVVSAKQIDNRQIIGVDTTVSNFAVMAVHGGYREIVVLHDTSMDRIDSALRISDVCGNTTFSRDYLGRSCMLPKVQIGDILAITDVGGYGFAMASHFLHRPKPAEVLINNGDIKLIRRRETYEVLLSGQVFDTAKSANEVGS